MAHNLISRPYTNSLNKAVAGIAYISHREEGLPRGDRRELRGLGAYKVGPEGPTRLMDPDLREKHLVERFRADAEGLQKPAFLHYMFTVNDQAARSLAAIPRPQAEMVMRDALEKAFQGVAKARTLQGVFAHHWHSSTREAHPHIHVRFSPRTSSGEPTFILRDTQSRIKKTWTRELDRAIERLPPLAPDHAPKPSRAAVERPVGPARPLAEGRPAPRQADAAAGGAIEERLRTTVRAAAEGRPTLAGFTERLRARAVTVRFALDQNGAPYGVSYRLGGRAIPGGSVGPEFTWRGVRTELGVSYDRSRDGALIAERGVATGKAAARVSYVTAQAAVRDAVDRALPPPAHGTRRAEGMTLRHFRERLAELWVKAHVALDRAGKPFSISYEHEGRTVAARAIGGAGSGTPETSRRADPPSGAATPARESEGPGYTWRDLVLKRGLQVDTTPTVSLLSGLGRAHAGMNRGAGQIAQAGAAVRALASPESMARFAVAQLPGVGRVFGAALMAEQLARNPLLTVAMRVVDKVLPPIPGLRAIARGLLSPEM